MQIEGWLRKQSEEMSTVHVCVYLSITVPRVYIILRAYTRRAIYELHGSAARGACFALFMMRNLLVSATRRQRQRGLRRFFMSFSTSAPMRRPDVVVGSGVVVVA